MFEALQALHTKLPFQLLVGSDILYIRALPAGADGVVSGVAGAVPELMVSLDRASPHNDPARALRLNTRLRVYSLGGKVPRYACHQARGLYARLETGSFAHPVRPTHAR